MPEGAGNMIIGLLPYVILLAGFYFLLIKPQQKKEKAVKNMRESLKEGDSVVTIGGIYGKILNVKDEVVVIEVGADKTKVTFAKWAIGKVVTDGE